MSAQEKVREDQIYSLIPYSKLFSLCLLFLVCEAKNKGPMKFDLMRHEAFMKHYIFSMTITANITQIYKQTVNDNMLNFPDIFIQHHVAIGTIW